MVLGKRAIDPWLAAVRDPPKKRRCFDKTTELLVELGPPQAMDMSERRVLNTLLKVCRSCGKCPEMQGRGVTTPAP